MDIMLERVLLLLGNKRGAIKALADFLGVSGNNISDWKSGKNKSYRQYAPAIAEYYGVSLDWLSGLSDQKERPLTIGEELSDLNLVRFPIIGTISAGNGCYAFEEYTGEYTYFASSDLHAPPDEYFVLRINGDSMYPKLLDGDYILVRKMPFVASGKIAVVLYNGEDATVKKLNYDDTQTWIELVPINPEYKTRRIEGSDINELRFLGEVMKLQRDL